MKRFIYLILFLIIISNISIKADKLYSWGWNYYGQLGDNTSTEKNSPLKIGKENNWKYIVCGDVHTIAIKSNGTLWAWGDNEYGQLGDGTNKWRYTPVQIGKETNWSQIICGSEYTLAIKGDGTLWAWGDNKYGQLGDGTNKQRYSPFQIGSERNWSQICAGGYFTVAIKNDGTLWAWGRNNYGQLGDSTIIDKSSPVQIGNETNWKQAACGNEHTLAIKNDGTLWAWGNDAYGQLGDGKTTYKNFFPIQIGKDNNWKLISCGGDHSSAIKNDGTLWAWGMNSSGQLGDGSNTTRPSPIQIGINNYLKVICGNAHTLAIMKDSSLWAWGLNNDGELGDGTFKSKSSPVKIGSAFHWLQVACGAYHSVALNNEPLISTPKITTNSPICEGDDLLLFADSIPKVKYYWFGPDGFISNQQNLIIKNSKSNQSGVYFVYTTMGDENSDTTSIEIVVNSNLVSPGDSSLIFVGSAVKLDKYIRLTDAKPWDGGSIWLKNRFSVKQDFTATFKFKVKNGKNSVDDDGSLPGADGFAFVMQNHNYPFLGDKGGSMGYTGITNNLAIEFDLFHNYWDPNGNHIAVQSMGSKPNIADHTKDGSCLGITDNIITIKQDSVYFAKIDYDRSTKTLKIYLDSTGKLDIPALTIPNIDLATYLQLEEGEYVYIGFTSGTGEAYQEHDLFDWTIPCKNQLVSVEEKSPKELDEIEPNIYPNPAKDFIYIKSSEGLQPAEDSDIQILNILGEIVLSVEQTSPSVQKLNISNLSPGIYFIKIGNIIEKFVKL